MKKTKISTAISLSNIEKILTVLEDTSQQLRALVSNLTEGQLTRPLEEGEWSLVEIMAHLRTCEEVSSHRIYWMLALENPNLTIIHPHQLRKIMHYERHPFQRSFQEFQWRREDLLHVLRNLKIEPWTKTSISNDRTHTVYSIARTIALHTEDHCDEIGDKVGQFLRSEILK